MKMIIGAIITKHNKTSKQTNMDILIICVMIHVLSIFVNAKYKRKPLSYFVYIFAFFIWIFDGFPVSV